MHIFFLLTYHIYFNWSRPFICHTLKIKTKGFPSHFNKRNGVVINSHCKFSLKKQISSKIKIIKAQMLTIDHYHQMVMAVTKQFCVAGIFNTVLYACFLTMRLFIFFRLLKSTLAYTSAKMAQRVAETFRRQLELISGQQEVQAHLLTPPFLFICIALRTVLLEKNT